MACIRKRYSSAFGISILFAGNSYLPALATSAAEIKDRSNKSRESSLTHAWISEALKHPIIMLSGGPGWTSPGQKQTIFLQPNRQNTYNNQIHNQVLGTGEFFIGLQKKFMHTIQSQWGGIVSASGIGKLNGQIWQFADPEFNNMNYTYNVNQFRLGIRSKWIADTNTFTDKFKPYVTGSIGLSFNHSFSFQNFATIPTVIANPNFQNNTLTSFSYSLGAGIQKDINNHIQVGLGYEFYDWGKSGLGRAPGQTLNSGLGMNHLYTQTLLFSLTYVIKSQ